MVGLGFGPAYGREKKMETTKSSGFGVWVSGLGFRPQCSDGSDHSLGFMV